MTPQEAATHNEVTYAMYEALDDADKTYFGDNFLYMELLRRELARGEEYLHKFPLKIRFFSVMERIQRGLEIIYRKKLRGSKPITMRTDVDGEAIRVELTSGRVPIELVDSVSECWWAWVIARNRMEQARFDIKIRDELLVEVLTQLPAEPGLDALRERIQLVLDGHEQYY